MERTVEPTASDEVGLLAGWLNFHRDALAAKCEGLSADQLIARSAEPSDMTLLGLVRHLTEMEHFYLVHVLGGGDRGLVYCTDEDPDADFMGLEASMVEPSMRRWRQEREAADKLISEISDMSEPVAVGSRSARWYIFKVIQEYARHNGHADIVCQRIDGATGE